MTKKDRIKNIQENCDGWADAGSDMSYVDKYYHEKRDEKIMFPFIYNITVRTNMWQSRCHLLIPKKHHIEMDGDQKIIVRG